MIFKRLFKEDSFGFTPPYHFLGPVKYVNHKGAKPMNIKWELENEMPPYLWKSAAKMVVG